MNEETIEYRLDQIEKKVDCVTNLLLQTQGQEYRITSLEKNLASLNNNKKKSIDRWLNPLVSTVVSALVAYIFVKVGLK